MDSGVGKGLITASSLGYRVFRQSIVAKYLAYDPPRPRLTFELATISLVRLLLLTLRLAGGVEMDVGGWRGGLKLGVKI